MAHIPMLEPEDCAPETAETMRKISGGQPLDHILKIHSLNPPSLTGHYDFYKSLMFGRSPLSRVQREMIAVVVSKANACHY